MKIAIIGTGMVGRGLAGRLSALGHEVVIGTRDVTRTLNRSETDPMGTPPYPVWQAENPAVRLLPLAEAGAFAELVINATAGAASLEALEAVGASNLADKVLLDLALPLDFSQGMPPRLLIAGDDSLGERIQRRFPQARVVKSLNTVFFKVMIDPTRVPGNHNIFVAGNDGAAKKTVRGLLAQFGWPEAAIIDLGGLETARATEMYMPLYFTLVGVNGGNFEINISVLTS